MRAETQYDDAAGEGRRLTRRTLLQRAAGLGLAASTLGALDLLALAPVREAIAAKSSLPEVQYQIERYGPRPIHVEGVKARMPPVYTAFATFTLTRTPTAADQATLASALARIESSYPFSPSGVFTSVAYGIPYFERLPGGMSGTLVASHMPRLLAEQQRYVLEEAVPSPTDVAPQNPGVSKLRFQVPVQIEANDVLVTVRSDSTREHRRRPRLARRGRHDTRRRERRAVGPRRTAAGHVRRLSFTQIGLPRKVAEEAGLDYAEMINPASPMWMGFVSQQVGTSGPPPITTFVGNASARVTTARGRDYFNHGSIVHLSHAIMDLEQFYERPSETYVRREAAMFSADPSLVRETPTSSRTAVGRRSSRTCSTGRSRPKRSRRDGDVRRQPHIAHTTRAAALEQGGRPHADAHPRRRSGVRLARRARRLGAAEAALRDLRAHGRFLRDDAPQPGVAGPRAARRRARAEPRDRALPHGHAPAELPRAAETQPRVSARRAHVSETAPGPEG